MAAGIKGNDEDGRLERRLDYHAGLLGFTTTIVQLDEFLQHFFNITFEGVNSKKGCSNQR